jgi:hypothetical protein
MMDEVQKHNSFNTNTPSSEPYRNYLNNFVCITNYKHYDGLKMKIASMNEL